ncbi:glycosyltransferase [Anaerovibrio lipolyticus]|uniref:glycosyltransferase n=1 Tax=Anaerovibrio lipolyticus TaxID=82374 RepID=UPI001F27F587|nr:glycosyltransferase [Anaerovibrio lipolyticus]MCF2600939.1 glycosyltransferase [Anaerovibrio lipolyticus]
MFNVAVVIVTYNRLEKLKIALTHYEKQLLLPKYIIVVDNNSTDGTDIYLSEWKNQKTEIKKHIISLKKNVGGAGGFYEGEKYAMQLSDIDWVMIADDDAYPAEDYLLGMRKYIKSVNHSSNISIVCGRVVESHKIENIHRTYWVDKWHWNYHKYVQAEDYERDVFYPDFVSYVGILIKKDILHKSGLVCKEFFIWNDDTEHSYRMHKYGLFVCLPKYKIYHDVSEENKNLNWKSYYSYRNKTIFFKRHCKLQFSFVILLQVLKSILCPIKGKSFTEVKLRLTAIKDGVLGNMGMNDVYKPGWKP